jgi:hypothetical protein
MRLRNFTAIFYHRVFQRMYPGNEVTNPFIVTEVYVKENGKWKMGSLSFTKTMTPQPKN